MPNGRTVEVPVFPGILKHPLVSELAVLLVRPEVALKYTREALRIAPWPILKEFPGDWLRENLSEANIRPGRLKALTFMLDARESGQQLP
jgi:hypothetical protein